MATALRTFAAALESATGLALITSPPLVARLLLGQGISGAGTAISRVAGIALLSLGLACWPARYDTASISAGRGLMTYNLLVALYLLGVGIGGGFTGMLLWPAVALHALLTLLLIREWFNNRTRGLLASHQAC